MLNINNQMKIYSYFISSRQYLIGHIFKRRYIYESKVICKEYVLPKVSWTLNSGMQNISNISYYIMQYILIHLAVYFVVFLTAVEITRTDVCLYKYITVISLLFPMGKVFRKITRIMYQSSYQNWPHAKNFQKNM